MDYMDYMDYMHIMHIMHTSLNSRRIALIYSSLVHYPNFNFEKKNLFYHRYLILNQPPNKIRFLFFNLFLFTIFHKKVNQIFLVNNIHIHNSFFYKLRIKMENNLNDTVVYLKHSDLLLNLTLIYLNSQIIWFKILTQIDRS